MAKVRFWPPMVRVLGMLGGLLAGGLAGLIGGSLVGGLAGLVLGALLSVLTFYGLVTIPPRRLFAATSVLVTLLAGGLAAQCVVFLQQAGYVTALSQTLWDTSAILPDNSLLGRVLHTLIGYSDQPSAMQGLVYVGTIAGIVVLTRLAAVSPPPASPLRAPAE
jgi:high-affinity iron transporter